MSRTLRLFWLAAFSLLWLACGEAHAQYRTGTLYQNCGNAVTPSASPSGICDQANAQDPNNPAGPYSVVGHNGGNTGLGCQRARHDRPTISICYGNVNQQGQCPQGSTQVGSTAQCTCNTGTTWNGSACVGSPDGCTPTAGTPSTSGPYTSNPGLGRWYSCDTTSAGANANCTMEHTPSMTSRSHSGQWYQSSTVRYTGQRCSGNGSTGGPTGTDSGTSPPASGASAPSTPNEPPPQACPARQCPGTVNGTSVCVPCGQTSTGNTTTQRDANGNVTGTQTTSTTCEGPTCTTTTTNRDGVGATTSTTTVQTTLGQYCASNPGSPNCNGNSATGTGNGNGAGEGSGSSFGGACGAGFSCEGDAVQCAIAREQHIRNCRLFDDRTEISDIGLASATGASSPSGHPINTPEVIDLNLSGRINQSALFGSDGGCPADVSVAFPLLGAVNLPFSAMCPSLGLIGNALVAFALLVASFVVFRQPR